MALDRRNHGQATRHRHGGHTGPGGSLEESDILQRITHG